MATVGSSEAQTHLPALLERVARGETITITEQGKPVARIVPVPPQQRPDVRKVIEERYGGIENLPKDEKVVAPSDIATSPLLVEVPRRD